MGGISNPSYRGPTEVRYMFIDGAYLNARLEAFSKEWFGVPAVADYQAIGAGFTKVFYYDCLPSKSGAESQQDFEEKLKRKEEHFDELRSLPGWHVSEGLTKRRRGKSTQKEVDILIAVDMLTHTYRKNMHRLDFIAGDQDFRPLIDAVVRDGMYVTLWYEPSSISTELKHTADATKELDLYTFHRYLSPAYRAVHPIPEKTFRPESQVNNGILLSRGFVGDKEVAHLWKSATQDHFAIIQTTPTNTQYLWHSMPGDVEFLKRVYAAYYGECIWIPIDI